MERLETWRSEIEQELGTIEQQLAQARQRLATAEQDLGKLQREHTVLMAMLGKLPVNRPRAAAIEVRIAAAREEHDAAEGAAVRERATVEVLTARLADRREALGQLNVVAPRMEAKEAA